MRRNSIVACAPPSESDAASVVGRKPAGEGTGLGLSISHDIIVKQHGGSIEVDTQPGEFTEIRIILPRVAVLLPTAP
jgi:signal transduction histidine kinase